MPLTIDHGIVGISLITAISQRRVTERIGWNGKGRADQRRTDWTGTEQSRSERNGGDRSATDRNGSDWNEKERNGSDHNGAGMLLL